MTVEVVNSTSVPFGTSNNLYLVGEVINRSLENVTFVRIDAVLRNDNGEIVDSTLSYADINVLAPGMTSSFRIIFRDTPVYASYELTLDWSKTTREPTELQITNLETYFDSFDAFHAKGVVTNQFAILHQFVKIFMVMYDANHHAIGTHHGHTSPPALHPGQQSPFDLDVYFWKGKPDHTQVASYSVRAYDD
ncbi:hypothetical protein BH10CHL1_BH10CHL1_02370 [soil metagenome]